MTNAGRKISSLSVTYQEEYQGDNWSSRRAVDHPLDPINTIDYHDTTASVPRDLSVGDLCDHTQSDILYEDLYKPVDPDTLKAGRAYDDGSSNNLPQSHPQSYGANVSRYYGDDLNHHGDDMTTAYPNTSIACSVPNYTVHQSNPVVMDTEASCYGNYPSDRNHALYGLEDRLRQRVNVHIEGFRADLQEVFYEQFDLYRQSNHEWPIRDQSHPRHCSGAHKEDGCVDGSCDSVCSNSEASCVTVDSGVGVTTHEQKEEENLNKCLIKLQMCAAAITSSLQRTEYAVS